ncbi:MAG TPA: hypothetical protein VMG12_12590 [Polyangiaceae bacterium]|nr:hypothetical protein [Polyangiaceae bacterium]
MGIASTAFAVDAFAAEPTAPASPVEPKPEKALDTPPPDEPAPDAEAPKPTWELEFSGYFRAPVAVGTSERPNPDGSGGQRLQLSYAPNRVVDADYNSFAYTRLQETDWGELYVTAKRPHVAATIAFMGYWYTWAGYENPKAAWVPAQAWVDLDTDVTLGPLKPHIDLKGGVFWQRWGMFEKYDTYLFGRFHQAGAALEVHVPFAAGEARLVEGLGTNRNGLPDVATGLTLLHYTHLGVSLGKWLDVGAYYNASWTRDPTLFIAPGGVPAPPPPTPGPNGEPGGGNYPDARAADMSVYGADVHLRLPRIGHTWVAASHIDVKNGWALPSIVEVMHSPGASGIADNYLGYGDDGTGSGALTNFALLYENSYRGLRGQSLGMTPDLQLNVFGMLAHVERDLLPDATITPDVDELKWGSDLTLKLLPWLAFMLRYDTVDVDAGHDGSAFRVLTPRVIFSSHALATESIWLQYSRYFYDDDVVLPTSASQPYPNPDRNVIKLQANLSF